MGAELETKFVWDTTFMPGIGHPLCPAHSCFIFMNSSFDSSSVCLWGYVFYLFVSFVLSVIF